ncbi:hypothetical protein KR222_005732, partial [Zaprionus bogoriensis]
HNPSDPSGAQANLQPPPPSGQSIAPTGAFPGKPPPHTHTPVNLYAPALTPSPPPLALPGSLTPGWNDPPPVHGDVTSSNRRPRLDLRKRVAHPMNANEPPLL